MTNTSQSATNTGGQTQVFSREIGGTVFELGIGRLAPSTLASVTIRYGDTVMLTTLCDGDARPVTRRVVRPATYRTGDRSHIMSEQPLVWLCLSTLLAIP